MHRQSRALSKPKRNASGDIERIPRIEVGRIQPAGVVGGVGCGGIAFVGQVAHVQEHVPAFAWGFEAYAGAEDGVGRRAETVGVVDEVTGGRTQVELGVEASGLLVLKLGLVHVTWQAGQFVAAEGVVVAIVEIVEGVGLAQVQRVAVVAFPQQRIQARLDPLMNGRAGVGRRHQLVLAGRGLTHHHGQNLVIDPGAIERQAAIENPGTGAYAQLGRGGLLGFHVAYERH